MAVALKSKFHSAIDIQTVKEFVTLAKNVVFGQFHGRQLRSAFQPIFSLAHKRVVGYEALIRVQDKEGKPVLPTELFSSESKESEIVLLDRLCRFIHLANFKYVLDDLNWLFLNVSPRVMASGPAYGPFFRELLKDFSFASHRIVIEIVEHPFADQGLLIETVNYYKSMGCLIAIDDFGAGHSNFERIWSLGPQIVKLDRSMIVQAAHQKKIRQLLPGIVSLLHQAGALVLAEGIEDKEQAMIAMNSDVDFVQGYHFSRPTMDFANCSGQLHDFDTLFNEFKNLSEKQERLSKNAYDRYKASLMTAVCALQKQMPIEEACANLLDEEFVVRCYLLRTDGIQTERTIVAPETLTNTDLRYKPLEDARSADWFRRYYLRRAIEHPDQLQITRPYLSITGGHMCITLSIMFSTPVGSRVLCCDLRV